MIRRIAARLYRALNIHVMMYLTMNSERVPCIRSEVAKRRYPERAPRSTPLGVY
jgi:hypothetical protein